MLFIAVGVIINGWDDEYASGLTSDFNDFNKLDDLETTSGTWQGNINPQSGEASSDYEAETFRGGYGIITNSYSNLRAVYGEDGVIDSAWKRFGLPSYIWRGLVYMFMIAITLAIIGIVFRLGRSP